MYQMQIALYIFVEIKLTIILSSIFNHNTNIILVFGEIPSIVINQETGI